MKAIITYSAFLAGILFSTSIYAMEKPGEDVSATGEASGYLRGRIKSKTHADGSKEFESGSDSGFNLKADLKAPPQVVKKAAQCSGGSGC